MKNRDNSVLIKIVGYYRLIEDIIMVFGMVSFGILIMYQITARAFGGSGITWLEEFSRYMFIIAVFIGSSRAVESNGHMVMDTLIRVLPVKAGQILKWFIDMLMVGFSIFICYFSYKFCLRLYRLGARAETVNSFQRWVIWVPIIICLFTMSIRYLVNAYKIYKDLTNK